MSVLGLFFSPLWDNFILPENTVTTVQKGIFSPSTFSVHFIEFQWLASQRKVVILKSTVQRAQLTL